MPKSKKIQPAVPKRNVKQYGESKTQQHFARGSTPTELWERYRKTGKINARTDQPVAVPEVNTDERLTDHYQKTQPIRDVWNKMSPKERSVYNNNPALFVETLLAGAELQEQKVQEEERIILEAEEKQKKGQQEEIVNEEKTEKDN